MTSSGRRKEADSNLKHKHEIIDKNRLRAFRSMATEVRLIDETIKAMRETVGAKTTNLSSSAGGSDSDGTATERTVEKLLALEAKYNKRKADYVDERQTIERAIEKLDPTQRALIRLYYMDLKTWEETAEALRFSTQHVHRIHAAALIELSNES